AGEFAHPAGARSDCAGDQAARCDALQSRARRTHRARRLPDRHGRARAVAAARTDRVSIMKIVSAEEMRSIDRATSERFGVPSAALMENAGTAVAEHVLAHYGSAQRITVFCGKGNNGGDGFVAARRLQEKGKTVQVILLADPAELRGDAAAMYKRLPAAPTIVRSPEELKSGRVQPSLSGDLYIDAILGTGFRPPLQDLYAAAIDFLNRSGVPVLAVDIPSGADTDALGPQKAAITRAASMVTFTAPRPAHVFGRLTNGPTCVASIGSPDEAV